MPSSRELLGPDGPFSAALAGYETRPGQLDMADAVERALDEDRIVMCEAGTGTGKTLAYLVPALRSGRRVVIATASRNLQEQIGHKDLPLAKSCLGMTVRTQVVKGLSNYVCLRRLNELRATAQGAGARVGAALPLIDHWQRRTTSGDFARDQRPPRGTPPSSPTSPRPATPASVRAANTTSHATSRSSNVRPPRRSC